MEITMCDVAQFCSGHASKCMQRGDKQKCKCDEGWSGRDCSTDEFGGGGGGGGGGRHGHRRRTEL
jgi:hypothetical protein